MLKITVPTPTTEFVLAFELTSAGGFAFALMRKTSRSGIDHLTSGVQSWLVSPSSQRLFAGLKRTMTPVLGGLGVDPGASAGGSGRSCCCRRRA
jgi:hypothetical protein